MEKIDLNFLISKKQNAEVYKEGIQNLVNEIAELKSKIMLTMSSEEKRMLTEEKQQREKEVSELQETYDAKRARVEEEIEEAKSTIIKTLDEEAKKLISREEKENLESKKIELENELADYEKSIERAREQLRELIEKDGGYEQDTVSLSKQLDGFVAYKTSIQENLTEVNEKLSDVIVREDNIEELKEVQYFRMRLTNFNYGNLENWIEFEEREGMLAKHEDEVLENEEKQRQEAEKRKLEENLAWEEYNAAKQKEQMEAEARRPIEEDLAWKEYEKDKDDDEIIVETPEEIEAREKWLNGELDSDEKPPIGTNPQKPKTGQKPPTSPKPNTRPIPPNPPVPPMPPKPKKPEIEQIIFDETNGWIETLDKNGESSFSRILDNYKLEKALNAEFMEKLSKRCKKIEREIGEDKYKGIDERILMLLEDIGTEEMIDQYVKSISEKDAEMPFSLDYNLKGIYEGRNTISGIKQINKWAKIAKKQNRGRVHIKKDNIVKRALENLKLRREKGMLLPAPLKEIYPISATKELLSKGKEVVPEKAKDVIGKGKDAVVQGAKGVGRFTSKKLSNAMRHGRNMLNTSRISAIRISGYFKGENPLVTKMKAENIRNKSFNQRLRENVHVDEAVAIENVKSSQAETRNREVVIENPDGTKEVGTRLWSIEDDNTK